MRKRMMDTQNMMTVVEHPAGGWTIAFPQGKGTIRVYGAQYETSAAAERSLQLWLLVARSLNRQQLEEELNRRLLEEVRA